MFEWTSPLRISVSKIRCHHQNHGHSLKSISLILSILIDPCAKVNKTSLVSLIFIFLRVITILCKSIATEFWRNSWLFMAFKEISLHFCDTYCFDSRDFSNDNSLCSMIHPEFPRDNSLLSKSCCDNSLLLKSISRGQEYFETQFADWNIYSIVQK